MMKQKIIFTLSICTGMLLASSLAFSQSGPPIYLRSTLGGSGADFIAGHRSLPDGGYIILGSTHSSDGDVFLHKGDEDIWLARVARRDSVNVNILWQKTFGGSGRDSSTYIGLTSDNGFIICANTNSTDGDLANITDSDNCLVMRLDSVGSIVWRHAFGSRTNDMISSIEQTSDGGFIFCGSSFGKTSNGKTDVIVKKLDSAGLIEWQKTYGGSESDNCTAIHQTKDGGYIFSATTLSRNGDIDATQAKGGIDEWIVKLNDTGAIIWQRLLGGSNNDYVSSIKQTKNNGYATIGSVSDDTGGTDIHLVQLDSSGKMTLEKMYGGIGNDFGIAINEQQTGYIVGAETSSPDITNHGMVDIHVLRINDQGTIQWKKWVGGSKSEFLSPIVEKGYRHGGLVFSATTYSTDGDVIGNHGGADIWLLHIGGDGSGGSGGVKDTPISQKLFVYPNPAHDVLHLSGDLSDFPTLYVNITNTLGISVLQKKINSTGIDVKSLDPGFYSITISDGKEMLAREKFLKQ